MKHHLRLAGAVLFAFVSGACQGGPGAITSPSAPSAVRAASATSSLLGATWRLVEINGQKALADVPVTAVFAAQDALSGSAGCNRYAGSAATDNGRLTVGGLASTMMYCADAGVMGQEDAYLSALAKVTGYSIVGTELRLSRDAGAATLVFQRE